MKFDKRLLEHLVCLECKSPLQLNDSETELLCSTCKLVYPVHNGTPVMLARMAHPPCAIPDTGPAKCRE